MNTPRVHLLEEIAAKDRRWSPPSYTGLRNVRVLTLHNPTTLLLWKSFILHNYIFNIIIQLIYRTVTVQQLSRIHFTLRLGPWQEERPWTWQLTWIWLDLHILFTSLSAIHKLAATLIHKATTVSMQAFLGMDK